MTKDIHMLVSMINMKLRDDDMKLVHVLSIYDLKEGAFLKKRTILRSYEIENIRLKTTGKAKNYDEIMNNLPNNAVLLTGNDKLKVYRYIEN